MNNILILKSCAYLFHWSHSNFCFSSQYETKKAYEAALRQNSTMSEADRTFKYILDANDMMPCIYIGDLMVRCNDMMSQHIEGDYCRCDIINNIVAPDTTSLGTESWTHHGHGWATSNKYTSLSIDTFSGSSLGYVQINFKGRYLRVNFANGKIYAFQSEYAEVDTEQICNLLHVQSAKAKCEITTAIETLIKTTLR